MRLFVAVDFSELRSYFEDIQGKLDQHAARLRLTETYHLTLKFLGDVMPQYASNIQHLLGNVSWKPFPVSIAKVGFFSPKSIHVVWAGLDDNRRIMALQAAVDNALRDFFPKEERFHPHITLARVKSVSDKQAFLSSLRSCEPEKKEFVIDKFKLVMSTLTSLGPIYEDLAVFPAKG